MIETCRRQGRYAFKYMQQAVSAWLHNVPGWRRRQVHKFLWCVAAESAFAVLSSP